MGRAILSGVGITLNVETVVLGRKQAGTAPRPVDIGLDPGTTTARNLIESVVRSEVAAYEERAEQRTLVRLLTERELVDGLDQGAIRSGNAEPVAPVDVDRAVDTALLAFDDGLYQLHVDDVEIESLNTEVVLTDRTPVMFLRLVALAGG